MGSPEDNMSGDVDRVMTVLLLEGSNIGAQHYRRVAEAVVAAIVPAGHKVFRDTRIDPPGYPG